MKIYLVVGSRDYGDSEILAGFSEREPAMEFMRQSRRNDDELQYDLFAVDELVLDSTQAPKQTGWIRH